LLRPLVVVGAEEAPGAAAAAEGLGHAHEVAQEVLVDGVLAIPLEAEGAHDVAPESLEGGAHLLLLAGELEVDHDGSRWAGRLGEDGLDLGGG
jgi:hypothetical protein